MYSTNVIWPLFCPKSLMGQPLSTFPDPRNLGWWSFCLAAEQIWPTVGRNLPRVKLPLGSPLLLRIALAFQGQCNESSVWTSGGSLNSSWKSKRNADLWSHFNEIFWEPQVAYLADIFEQLNRLNLKLQGMERKGFHLMDRLCVFLAKLQNWQK